jgi:hypothetical protein
MLAGRCQPQFLVSDHWSTIRPDWGPTWPSTAKANLDAAAHE